MVWEPRCEHGQLACSVEHPCRECRLSKSGAADLRPTIDQSKPKSGAAKVCNCWAGHPGMVIRMTTYYAKQRANCPVHGRKRGTR